MPSVSSSIKFFYLVFRFNPLQNGKIFDSSKSIPEVVYFQMFIEPEKKSGEQDQEHP